MGLRIHFSSHDMNRVTIDDAPDPLWELLLSLHMLQSDDGPEVFGRWRDQVRRTQPGRRLFRIAPPRGYSPDFLTPAEAVHGVTAGIEAVLSTPRTRLRSELGQLTTLRDRSSWERGLADGDREAVHELGTTLRGYYQDALAPHWPHMTKRVSARRVGRGTSTAEVLSTLHPKVRWRAPVLELDGDHVTGDLHLDGRGLRLIPSFFCWRTPTVLADQRLAPVLVYPIDRDQDRHVPSPALIDLLGSTRAQVLAAAGGCTTSELARRLAISMAGASYHTGILRQAGLLRTQRTGSSVRHDLTRLGLELLGTNA